ncbi:MAG: TIGR00341 family protein [Flavobacteriales bacterium]
MKLLELLRMLRLGDNAEDPQAAMEAIARGAMFRGTNLLILVFAILIASVGLNMNSAAVVIGAMLISPLMGPIVAVGAGLGVMDLRLVEKALKNLGFAVVASLVTSTLYFLISPLDDAHSEILARTTPTIWDVLIAFAGGFAGIIAIASKERGNVVPGVAIATALMPPLCTAGYGLAHLNWPFFFGAFYLFVINSVFIGIATLTTVRWLSFPSREIEDKRVQRQVRRITRTLVTLTVIPSIYLAYRLVGQNAFERKAATFISAEASIADNYLVEREVDAPERTITLTYVGNGISADQDSILHQRLKAHGIPQAKLILRAGLSLHDLEKEQDLREEGAQREQNEKKSLVAELGGVRDSLRQITAQRTRLLAEAKAEHPQLVWLGVCDLPGATPQGPHQVVAAYFTEHPDTTEVGRLNRWLDLKLPGGKHALVISSGKAAGKTKAKSRRK